jgi:AraC-like DNA-binding protein
VTPRARPALGQPEEGHGGQAPAARAMTAQEPAAGCPVCGCQPDRAPHPDLPAGRAARLVAWLADNCHRPGLRVGEIAAAAGLSTRRLQAICQRDFGRTPMQLLAEIRLHRAHLALTGPHPAPRSLAKVARSAGFTRVTRFTRAYRHRYGTVPAITADPSPGQEPRGWRET